MIDGVFISEVPQIKSAMANHYRKLKQIANKSQRQLSWMSSDFISMTRRRQVNHNNWKEYKINRQKLERSKSNAILSNKLIKISKQKSQCSPNAANSDSLLRYHQHEPRRNENYQLLTSRLMKIKGNILAKRHAADFDRSRACIKQLQKFDRFKRMSRLISRSLLRN